MTGLERRAEMIEQIQRSAVPLSGKSLAETYGVSRQVIVQDIALIRAAGYHVISTNRGYVLEQPVHAVRVFKVNHTDEQLEEELCSIVDLGGCVENVMVNHRVYGQIEANLQVNSRRKAGEFMEDIYHYHKVSADSEKTLDLIEKTLKEKGFLIECSGD